MTVYCRAAPSPELSGVERFRHYHRRNWFDGGQAVYFGA